MNAIIAWLETHMLPCMIKWMTGFDCPGCGMQRSFVLLLKGDFYESMIMFPPLLPLLLMVSFLMIHLKFKFSFGASVLKVTFILNTIILLSNYILKMAHHGIWTNH